MRRWLLWTLRCHRGRDCARLTVVGHSLAVLPPGSVAHVDYTCANCMTEYRLEVFVDGDDLVELNRERRA